MTDNLVSFHKINLQHVPSICPKWIILDQLISLVDPFCGFGWRRNVSLAFKNLFFQIQIKTSRFKCTLGLSALYVVVQKRSLTHIDFFWVSTIFSNLEYYITQKHHSEIGQLVKTTSHNNLEDL